MKLSLKSLFIVVILFAINMDADAQRKRKRVRPSDRVESVETDEDEPRMSFKDNINYEIKVGNLSIGNVFSIATKPSVGYKLHKYGSAGIGTRLFYVTGISNGLEFNSFDYGFFGYGRVRLGNSFYLQGEYTTYSLDYGIRENLAYPLFGAGYVTPLGGGAWNSGFELLFIGSSEARIKTNSVVEWWFTFSYNF